MQAICNGDYKFEPAEYWANVSDLARDFVRSCLTVDPTNRPTSAELLQHPWLKQYATAQPEVQQPEVQGADLLSNVKAGFDAKKTCTSMPCSTVGRRFGRQNMTGAGAKRQAGRRAGRRAGELMIQSEELSWACSLRTAYEKQVPTLL